MTTTTDTAAAAIDLSFGAVPSVRFAEGEAARFLRDGGADLSSRDAYLLWVARWKAHLAVRVAEIVAAKRVMRDGTATDSARASAQEDRAALRGEVTNLIALRHAARAESLLRRAAVRA